MANLSSLEENIEHRYLSDPNQNGWILAVPDGTDPALVAVDRRRGFSLPCTLKVQLLHTSEGRDYFQILEGHSKGLKGSLKFNQNGQSYFTQHDIQKPSGIVKLSRKRQQVWYGMEGPFSAFSELSNPVPMGKHDLEIPDLPHEDYYPESSKYQRVWFRIGHHGDRYLHLGTISHGCATVRPWLPDKSHDRRFQGRSNSELGLPAPNPVAPFAKRDDLCRYLLPCRKGDGLSVGTLQVLD